MVRPKRYRGGLCSRGGLRCEEVEQPHPVVPPPATSEKEPTWQASPRRTRLRCILRQDIRKRASGRRGRHTEALARILLPEVFVGGADGRFHPATGNP